MPELPEVETVVRGLNAQVKGLTIKRIPHVAEHIRIRDNDLESLCGDTFLNFGRRGKYIIAELESGRKLMIHLRMSGRILLVGARSRRDKHDHFIATFTTGSDKLVFRDTRKFGLVQFLREDQDGGISLLGIEATEITGPKLKALLESSNRPVKALLLDQSALAGLGNIYVDESLFRSGIHPLRVCRAVNSDETRSLAANIRLILRNAVNKMGTTFDSYEGVNGKPGEYSLHLRVYNREGELCRRCGDTIVKIRAAGRGTHFCPTCQK
ncbi:MAG: bifunctional DNA-formamidopyrimidine glycosylase/DNA-(apurinic or apyrimidinic site) lyase [Candidatus Zixiibacteriota bacterium]